jgi:hypothetical protein
VRVWLSDFVVIRQASDLSAKAEEDSTCTRKSNGRRPARRQARLRHVILAVGE